MAGNGESTRAIVSPWARTLAIAGAKGVAAFFTMSSAMLAETVHSLADCGNQLLLLLGLRQARQPASPEYPLGQGKAIYFWSFLVAVILFTVGGMFSVYEGVHKLEHPEPLAQWWWAVGVLVFSLVAEGVSMRAACKKSPANAHGRSLFRWFRESRQAELVVIVGENLAAMLGLARGAGGDRVDRVDGNPLWDAVGTIVIGLLLIVVAVFVAVEVMAMLIGQSVDPAIQAKMRKFLDDRPEMGNVISLITLQLGKDMLVSVQAEMSEEPSARSLALQINEVERALKREFPDVRWSFFEPDIEAGI